VTAAFNQKIALTCAQSGEGFKNPHALGGTGVQWFGQGQQLDPALMNLGNPRDYFMQARSEDIKPPNYEDIIGRKARQAFTQRWAPGTGIVLEYALAARLLQRFKLAIEVFFSGRFPGVSAFHNLLAPK
jgi:hypothetical protein